MSFPLQSSAYYLLTWVSTNLDTHSTSRQKHFWILLLSYNNAQSLSHTDTQRNKEKTTMVKDRKIGVALDFSKSSKNAIKWALDNLADKGDTIYIIHVNPNSLDDSRNQLWAQSGCRESFS